MEVKIKSIDEMLKDLQEKREIKCPHCKEVQGNDNCQYPVTYHGSEEGDIDWECDSCGKKFFVREVVDREYRVGVRYDKFGDLI